MGRGVAPEMKGRGMRVMKRMPWLLGLPAVLAGCATLSDEECRQAAASPQGWTAVGERDGARGRTPDDRLARHRKACESTHVEPDQTRYMAGWNTGIRRYCTAQTA